MGTVSGELHVCCMTSKFIPYRCNHYPEFRVVENEPEARIALLHIAIERGTRGYQRATNGGNISLDALVQRARQFHLLPDPPAPLSAPPDCVMSWRAVVTIPVVYAACRASVWKAS